MGGENCGDLQNPAGGARVRETARELVDYLLFVDEAPLSAAVSGASGFAEQFPAAGPRDKKGAIAAPARSRAPAVPVSLQLP